MCSSYYSGDNNILEKTFYRLVYYCKGHTNCKPFTEHTLQGIINNFLEFDNFGTSTDTTGCQYKIGPAVQDSL